MSVSSAKETSGREFLSDGLFQLATGQELPNISIVTRNSSSSYSWELPDLSDSWNHHIHAQKYSSAGFETMLPNEVLSIANPSRSVPAIAAIKSVKHRENENVT
jgi:hypothetical protein